MSDGTHHDDRLAKACGLAQCRRSHQEASRSYVAAMPSQSPTGTLRLSAGRLAVRSLPDVPYIRQETPQSSVASQAWLILGGASLDQQDASHQEVGTPAKRPALCRAVKAVLV